MIVLKNKAGGAALFRQLEQSITELVAIGALKPGEQLPSVRTLAVELGINPNTVSKAYAELEHKGIVYSLAGKGSFICEDEVAGAVALEGRKALSLAAQSAKTSGVSHTDARKIIDEAYAGEGNKGVTQND